uniref:Uncharacterized protein n=1 Tax=viral metagenome TaxID=1070528 RepID=A0A6C0D0S0_9ZZZZ
MRFFSPFYVFLNVGIIYAFPFYTMNPQQLQPRYYEILQNYNAYLNQRRLACITFDFSIQSNTSVVYTFTGISNNTQDLRVIEGLLSYPYLNDNYWRDWPSIPDIHDIPEIPDIPDIPDLPDLSTVAPTSSHSFLETKNVNDITKCWSMSAMDTVPPSSKDQSWCILELDNNTKADWMIVTDSISQMTFALVSDIYNFTLRDIIWEKVNTIFPTTNFRNITGNCPVLDPHDSKTIPKNEKIN